VACVWDAKTGRPVGKPMNHNDTIKSVVFSPNSNLILTASRDKTAQIWDVETGNRVGQPMTSARAIYTARFSPDGKWVLTVDASFAARIWDAETGLPAGLPLQHADSINAAVFSPDSKCIVTASDDGTARIWDAVYTGDSAPPWLSDLAEVTAGQFLGSRGILEPSRMDPADVRSGLRQLQGDDDLSRFGRWLVSDPSSRTLGPLSSRRVSDVVTALITENRSESLNAAFDMDPGNPEVLVAMARFMAKQNRNGAQFCLELALHNAHLANSSDQVAKVQRAAKDLFPDIPHFGGPAP
jgi:hypothetical protein